jgi:hypothetical protein
MLRPSFAFALSAGALVLAGPGLARAGSFTPEGAFLFDPNAAVVLDFEGDPPAGAPPPVADPAALQGKKVVPIAAFKSVSIPVTLPPVRRSYRAAAWIKDHEASLGLRISYSDRVDEVVALYPTGRVTSDGWVEVGNQGIRIDGPRLKQLQVSAFSAQGATLDAVELVPDGDESVFPPVPNAKCGGVAASGVCAADQVCIYGECRNVAGWVPPIPEERDHVTDYLQARMTALFGPYHERSAEMPGSLVAMEQMRQAKDPWGYWNGFALAVRRLHDGHTTTSNVSDFAIRNPHPIAVCFLEGDADLSHQIVPKDPSYLDVLVSHTGPDHTLGLAPGDRLVSVDGQHPIAWARSLITVHWSLEPVSNPRTFAELASSLRGLIARYAGEIQVLHCDPQTKSCGEPQTISIADLPADPPGTMVSSPACDNRPLRHLKDSPADHNSATSDSVYSGIVVESNPTEKIYGLEWESLYSTDGTDGVAPALKQAVNTWVTDGANGVVLDHRTGVGGTLLGPEILWGYAVPQHAADAYMDRQRAEDEQPSLADGKAAFDDAVAAGQADYAGSPSPVTNVPVALLLTQDVSASDWLPLGMKGAPKVRLFAPFETNGGFSTRYAFGYWLGVNYVIAVGDTFLPDGSTANGTGVSPDVVVLPKQSDLLAGKDTVYEAAIAWIRSEMAP